ncbi:MAG: hypothetical protein ABEJ07_00030 [Candidatus Nanohaloarchaea archaeon]
MTKENLVAEKTSKVIDENREGLESLAREEQAQKEREHPVKTKVKRLYKRYVKKPKAEPLVV